MYTCSLAESSMGSAGADRKHLWTLARECSMKTDKHYMTALVWCRTRTWQVLMMSMMRYRSTRKFWSKPSAHPFLVDFCGSSWGSLYFKKQVPALFFHLSHEKVISSKQRLWCRKRSFHSPCSHMSEGLLGNDSKTSTLVGCSKWFPDARRGFKSQKNCGHFRLLLEASLPLGMSRFKWRPFRQLSKWSKPQQDSCKKWGQPPFLERNSLWLCATSLILKMLCQLTSTWWLWARHASDPWYRFTAAVLTFEFATSEKLLTILNFNCLA